MTALYLLGGLVALFGLARITARIVCGARGCRWHFEVKDLPYEHLWRRCRRCRRWA